MQHKYSSTDHLTGVANHCCAVIRVAGEPTKTAAAATTATTATTAAAETRIAKKIPEVEPSQATPGLTEGERALAAAERDSSATAGLKQQPKEIAATTQPPAQHALAF